MIQREIKKNKNVEKEEFSSDKKNKNNQNKDNNINISDNVYNDLRSENSPKFNINKNRIEYEKKNDNIINNIKNNNLSNNNSNSNSNNNSISHRDKEKRENKN